VSWDGEESPDESADDLIGEADEPLSGDDTGGLPDAGDDHESVAGDEAIVADTDEGAEVFDEDETGSDGDGIEVPLDADTTRSSAGGCGCSLLI